MVDTINVNDIVDIDGKEYQVINKVDNYYLLASTNPKILDVLVGTIENDEFVLVDDEQILLKLIKTK